MQTSGFMEQSLKRYGTRLLAEQAWALWQAEISIGVLI